MRVKSLSLILLGKKALYIGARDYILEELKPYIKNEEIIVHNSKYLDKKEKTYTICRSDCNYYFEMAKDNIKQIKLIMHSYYKRDKKISNNKINELLTHDRSLGRLLGYFEADIEAYCEKRKWNLRNGLSL